MAPSKSLPQLSEATSASLPVPPPLEYKPLIVGLVSHLRSPRTPHAELMSLDRPAGYYAIYWHYVIGLSLALIQHCPRSQSLALPSISQILLSFSEVQRAPGLTSSTKSSTAWSLAAATGPLLAEQSLHLALTCSLSSRRSSVPYF